MKLHITSLLILLTEFIPAASSDTGFAYPSRLLARSNHPKTFTPFTFATGIRRTRPIRSYVTTLTSSSVHDVQHITEQVIEEYELNGRFERWSFLQKLLENELPLKDIEHVMLAVFHRYLMHGPSSGAIDEAELKTDDNEGLPSPVLDDKMRESIEKIIHNVLDINDNTDGAESRFLHLFVQPSIDYELETLMGTLLKKTDEPSSTNDIDPQANLIINQIEQLLPDPIEEEEAHKSAWDLVMELYGREAVKVREEALGRNYASNGGLNKENLSWKTLCCIGRVLIHYDFLTKGILSSKL